jgi:hypothetical protein
MPGQAEQGDRVFASVRQHADIQLVQRLLNLGLGDLEVFLACFDGDLRK